MEDNAGIGTQETVDYAVVMIITEGKIGDAERPIRFIPRLFVTGAPADAKNDGELARVIMDAGYFFGVASTPWANHFTSPEDKWKPEIKEAKERGNVETISYAALLEGANKTRRITLRLPPGLHGYLTNVARGQGLSLNKVIVGGLMDWRDDPYRVK